MTEKLFSELNKLKSSPSAIIVEGKNDKKALEEFGIKNIYTINRPIFQLSEDISKEFDSVVILTDLDKEGRKLYSKLKENFQRLGVRIDDSFREMLFKETSLAQIEGLNNYMRRKDSN